MRVQAAIIGGTGIGERLLALGGAVTHVPTTRGFVRGRVVQLGGKDVFVMSRHSAGHKVPPHKVDYEAMTLALQALEAPVCFATAAVGSLRQNWGAGTLVVCSDFIDLTGRFPTLFDQSVVHTDFSQPLPGRAALLAGAQAAKINVEDGGVYVCGNGPRYETPEEIALYSKFGGDVVGMTAASEAILMHEAGIAYGCLAIVTNLACGITEAPLSHEEVVEEMERSGGKAMQILEKAVASL